MRKTFSVVLVALLGMLLATSCGNAPKGEASGKSGLKRVTDYLYEITMDKDFDYSIAMSQYEKFRPNLPACSSISLGDFRGRNLDWNYENGAEFVIRTTKKDDRHASLGMVSAPFLSNDVVADGEYHQEFELLPYATLDGINDAGMCVNLNVVAFNMFGPWKMKTESTDDDMMEFLAPRLILDKCSYLSEVVPTMEEYDWFSVGNEFETHLMVTGPRSADDPTVSTVVLEYIPFTEGERTFRKVCCISPDEKDVVVVGGDSERFYHSKAEVFIMTNFNLWQFDASLDRKGRLLSASALPMGFERYEILEAAAKTGIGILGSTDSLVSQHMQDIMFTVNYSNMYNIYQDNFWYSDYMPYITKEELLSITDAERSPHGDMNNLYKGKDNSFVDIYKNILLQWGKRDRRVKNGLWETLHTSVYNYKTRTMDVSVREGAVYYRYEL